MSRQMESELISLISPAVPMYGVFYEEGEPQDIVVLPVVVLAIVEEKVSYGGDRVDRNRVIRPLVFDQFFGVDVGWRDESDTLGFLLQEDIPKAAEIFADEIARERKKRAELRHR